jgi:hypothetical protein
MTLHELARVSGVSVRAIGDMERGRSCAQARTLKIIADALGLDAGDRAALAAAAAAARSAPSFSCPLPRDVPDFTGRAAELRRLAARLGDDRPVIVHGQPGVGKTALAVRAATMSAGALPGGAYFLDCRGTGPAPAHPADLAARLRAAVSAGPGSRRLVVLDDVADGRQVLPLLPLAGAAVLITGRGPLPGIGAAARVPLSPLPVEEAAALLGAITGGPADACAVLVAGQCGCLPLALRIAGNRVAGRPGWTLAHLADRLADEERRLPALSAGDLSVEAALAPSFARLSERTRVLCHRLADAGAADFDPGQAAVLTGVDVGSARQGIAELVDAGLLTTADGAGRHHYHDLVRLFARRLLPAATVPE